MATDLAEFLRARLDEDERAARLAQEVRGVDDWTDLVLGVKVEGADIEVATPHLARCDPARVLREVEAKRAIIAAHATDPDGHCSVCLTTRDRWQEDWPLDEWPCQTILAVAAVYSDHPDCRQEWKP